MKAAAALLAMLALSACDRMVEEAVDEVESLPDPYAEFERHWPGHITVSDDYRIQATFPDDQPVCVSDTFTHIHGFHQFRAGDCADEGAPSDRFISVWGDYNAAFEGWAEAEAGRCGADTEPFDLGVDSLGEGRFAACIPKVCGDQYVITAVYLSDSPAMDLGDDVEGGGPDLIYTIALGTTPETEEADLEAFRTFLSQLRLDGGRFLPG